ncbi:MAG: aminotransferase class I/II-fold pyridoxal phosphate-dependent enzyme, partial [Candidatus Micrarchaeaceae archaeon]
MDAKAKSLRARGYNVINFGVGEPDLYTPNNVKKETIEAVRKNFTKYTNVMGTIELREAIAKKLKRDNRLDYTASEIIVSNGAKHSLYNAMLATINPGDEVIIPNPYWVTYPYQVKLCGGKPVFTKTDEKFIPIVDDICNKITKKTKLIVINTPNNPTGAVYPEKILRELANIAMDNKLIIISDEIYEKMTYEGRHRSIASISNEAKD